MESYIDAAQQVKDDILLEYQKDHPHITMENMRKEAQNASEVIGCIDIFFRNAAKNKLFSEKIQKTKSKELKVGDLLPAYLTTSEDDSYHDTLEAIKSSKKIGYLLFLARFEKFQITERTKYGDILRRQESICPERAIQIYNGKKSVVQVMSEPRVEYSMVAKGLTNYIKAIQGMLTAQQKVYACERDMVIFLDAFLKSMLEADGEKQKHYSNATTRNALGKVLVGLADRGLEMPKTPEKITPDYVNEVRNLLQHHGHNLVSEDEMLGEVIQFCDEVVKYSDERMAPKEKKTKGSEDKGFVSMLEDLPAKFTEWLRQ